MKELIIPAKIENLDTVLDFMNALLEENDCNMKAQIQLDVAIEEMFVNIAHYAYGSTEGNATIQIDFSDNNQKVSITLIDSGIEFDPLAKPDPDITLSAEERNIGGLGIYMVKKSMDSVSYKRENNFNIFNMTKTIK